MPTTLYPAGPAGCTRELRRQSRRRRSAAALLVGLDGRPALLVSVFIPKGESAPGESGTLVQWREL